MSYEGYVQKLCEAGHYSTIDAHSYDTDSECSVCGKPFVWTNEVDDTNCDAVGYIPMELLLVKKGNTIIEKSVVDGQTVINTKKYISEYRIPSEAETMALRTIDLSGTNGEVKITINAYNKAEADNKLDALVDAINNANLSGFVDDEKILSILDSCKLDIKAEIKEFLRLNKLCCTTVTKHERELTDTYYEFGDSDCGVIVFSDGRVGSYRGDECDPLIFDANSKGIHLACVNGFKNHLSVMVEKFHKDK